MFHLVYISAPAIKIVIISLKKHHLKIHVWMLFWSLQTAICGAVF